MRVLLIDTSAQALDMSMRMQACGHEVKHFIRQTEKSKYIGRGLVNVVEDFKPWLRWPDLIVLSDNTRYLRDMRGLLNQMNMPIVGANEESAALELDRKVGQDFFKKKGIQTIPGKEFRDYDEAIAYVKKRDCRLVSKPSGDVEDKALSYVSKSPSDMVYMLERWKRAAKHKDTFILQEFVEGVEMAVGAWFGPGGFNEGWLENFEFKSLMNDEKGPKTGEAGTILRYVKQSKLARKVLEPLEDELGKLGYIGYIDVNCIIDDKGQPWPLEWTARFGWPTANIQCELHHEDWAEWLLDLATGKDARSVNFSRIAAGVVLAIPDYPYSHLTRKEVVGVPVYGLTESLWRHWHPCEMMLGKDVPNQVGDKHIKMPMPVTAGDYVGVMSATGTTVKDAALACYRRLDKLTVPNSPMWRTDIGKRLAKQLPKIQPHGYATGMTY